MKDLWVLDFETYYSSKYSLSKLTTEEYIRHPDFEVIGLAMKRNDEPAYWVDGPDVSAALSKIDWSEVGVIAHNTLFDGAILSWLYGVRPKMWFDTLSMARAIRGVEKSASLKALADAYGIGAKGDEVVKAMGKRRADFTPWELASYGGYACNDAELCARLFRILMVGFPRAELQLIDMTLRMFTQPTFELDLPLLQKHLEKVRLIKADLLASSGTTKEELMSNPKFAEALRALGVEPPMKVSPTTGKPTFAFAKSDEDFKALQEHEDVRVQAIVAARIGAKSTLEETRTERFIGIGERGSFPIPLKYYAAHTGRWGGCLVADTTVTVVDADRNIYDKRIVDVLRSDLVWDGVAFVPHDGVVLSGYSEVVSWDGVTGTADHIVFTDAGEISLRDAMQGAHPIQTARRPTRDDVDPIGDYPEGDEGAYPV